MQIVAGEMYVAGELVGYPDFNRYVKLFLLDVARHHKLPDVDLILSTSDKCHPAGKYRGSSKKCPLQVLLPVLRGEVMLRAGSYLPGCWSSLLFWETNMICLLSSCLCQAQQHNWDDVIPYQDPLRSVPLDEGGEMHLNAS